MGTTLPNSKMPLHTETEAGEIRDRSRRQTTNDGRAQETRRQRIAAIHDERELQKTLRQVF